MIDKIPSQESLHAVGNVRAYMKCANLCAEAKENPPRPYSLSTHPPYIRFSYSNPRGGGRVGFLLWLK
jgi:hypothetical protein